MMCIVIVFCFYTLRLLVGIIDAKRKDGEIKVGDLRNESRDPQTEPIRRDCDLETVYSMDDAQCFNVCKTSGVFRTKNGVCVNTLIFETQATQNKCSAKDGVLAYLVGDPVFGRTKTVCLSVDLGVRPDNLDKPNIICRDGEIPINYVIAFPQLKDCRCANGKILSLIESTNTIRTHGVCVNDKMKPVLETNSLLYHNVV